MSRRHVPRDETEDRASPFVPGPRAVRAPRGQGPLSGLSFAVKDVFDVAGERTTYGCEDWDRTHPAAAGDAPVVAALLEAGARLAGKTKTVEMAFGLTGENAWHGTPVNPAAPDRLPGGSSCGSAAAVAGGHADFALGTDTGGSVRIPASYCGLFGFRPTHGAIGLAGARNLAPTLDAAGWFAPGARLLETVGDVLLPPGPRGGGADVMLLRPATMWLNADPPVADALAHASAALQGRFGRPAEIRVAHEGLAFAYARFREVQAEEAWATLGTWVTQARPRFGPGVAERFKLAEALTPAEAAAGRAFRRDLQRRVWPLLDGGAIAVFPTSPSPAPPLDSTHAELTRVREATISVTAFASLCGLPEVTVPVARVGGAPVGLSFMAGRGRDRALLAFAREAAEILGLPA
jgi:amidase